MHNTINPNDYGVLQPNGLIYPYKCPHCGEENPKAYDIGCYLKIGNNNRLFSSCVKPNHAMHPDWEKALFPDSAGNPMYQKIIPYRSNGKSSTSYTSSTSHNKPEGEWYYHDKQGKPLVKIARYRNAKGEKYYVQYHYTSEGKWEKGVKGYVERKDIPIYRYRKIRNSIESGETIWIIEGEKCADRLWRMGIAATTNIGGAGKGGNKWKPSDTACLDGAKEIVLVPDQNKPGIEHMNAVHEQLLEHSFSDSTIKWLYPYPDSDTWDNIPEKKGLDIYDWIEDGATHKQILASIQDTKRDIVITSNRAYIKTNKKNNQILSNNVSEAEKLRIEKELEDLFWMWVKEDKNSPPVKRRKPITNSTYLEAINIVYGERLRYNLLTLKPWLDNKPFEEVEGSLEHLYIRLSSLYNIELPKEKMIDSLLVLAKEREFNPVIDYLRRVEREVEPIDDIYNLAARYFGLTDELSNTCLGNWLLSAVGRALYPGCYTRQVLVLQGKTNIGKSTFFRILGGEFFSDSLGNAKDKDQLLVAGGNWILEWAEIETMLTKKLAGEAKHFITATSDCLRKPYGRNVETIPRGFVLCGTCNEHRFFNDPTGNDRYDVISVKQKIPLEQLKKDRDAIWSAAIRIILATNIEEIMSGNLWKTPAHLQEAKTANTEQYVISHEWEEDIQEIIEAYGSSGFILADTIWQKLGIEPKDKKKYGTTLYNLMTSLGWKKSAKLRKGSKKRHRVWMLIDMTEQDIDELWNIAFPELENSLRV